MSFYRGRILIVPPDLYKGENIWRLSGALIPVPDTKLLQFGDISGCGGFVMGRLYGLAGSSLVGNIFCGLAAYYAAAGYYGWNTPTASHSSGVSAMLANSGHPALITAGLFIIGLICSLPGWIAVYKSFYSGSSENASRVSTTIRAESDIAPPSERPSKPSEQFAITKIQSVNADLSQSIYIGHIGVDFQHLEKGGYLDFTIHAFNGGFSPISIDEYVEGVIEFCQTKKDLGQTDVRPVTTSPPQISTPRSQLSNVIRCNQFAMGLEQRVPTVLATTWLNFLSKGGAISFYFGKIAFRAHLGSLPKIERIAPWGAGLVWGGVTCVMLDGIILCRPITVISLPKIING